MRVVPKKTSKFVSVLQKHIKENAKAYFITSIIILIGIVLGVIFVNNLSDIQKQDIHKYFNDFTSNLKNGSTIDKGQLLKKSLINNIILVLFMWFVGSTVIGIPIVYAIVLFRGFSIGYTISAGVAAFGIGKGALFCITSMLLHNLIFVPCIIALAVSGSKLYKSILKDKRKENIKFEIFRHTIFSGLMLGILAISAVVETYISSNLLLIFISYF